MLLRSAKKVIFVIVLTEFVSGSFLYILILATDLRKFRLQGTNRMRLMSADKHQFGRVDTADGLLQLLLASTRYH